MEVHWVIVAIVVICLPMQCLTVSLQRVADDNEGTKDEFGTGDVVFTAPGSPGDFQSWSDWLNKRSFGEFPFGDKHLQAWKEWVEKRSLLQPGGVPKFGASNNFQQWKDWMNKRGGRMLSSNDAPFQTWSDWLKKRGLGGSSGPTFGRPSGGNYQSWGDFNKRANLDSDFSDINKRNFGLVKPNNPFNVRFGSNPNLMKWDDMVKRSNSKRQLGNSPAGFGNSKQYFANGLQDWRYTFHTSKRADSTAKNTKHESN